MYSEWENDMKKKILFINGHLNVGGVEKSLVDILQHIDYRKFDVELLLLEELGDYKEEVPKQVNIRLLSLKNTYGALGACLVQCIKKRDWFSFCMRLILLSMKLFGQKNIKKAKKILTKNKHYDCVIGFRSGICSLIAAFAVDADKRIIWWHHGEFNVSTKKYETIALACDKVISVSQSCADMLIENVSTIKSKLVVIPNMLDGDRLQKKCEEGSPYNGNGIHIVTVCRISHEKHIENVIYAATYLKKMDYQFCWHIVGDGILKKEMESLAIDNEVSDCVVFEGSKTNPYPYMKYATLYVHPSYVESQGLTILEAMSLQVPCVVTKSRGPCEFIQDSVNGVLVEQSPDALINGILRILMDKELYKRIKENTCCPEKFSPEQVMKTIEKEIICTKRVENE